MPPLRYIQNSQVPTGRADGAGVVSGGSPLHRLGCVEDEMFADAVNLDGATSGESNGPMDDDQCLDRESPVFDKPIVREMEKTIEGSRFIAQHVKNKDKFESVSK